MRPLKEIFVEEYWDIAFRRYSNNDTVVDADKKSYAFDELKATKRYWYADPFFFEKNNRSCNITTSVCIILQLVYIFSPQSFSQLLLEILLLIYHS